MTTIVVIEISCMLSVGAIHFEDKFCASRKVGQGEAGGCTALDDSTWWLLQLAIEKCLVTTGWSIHLLSCTNERRKRSFHLVGTSLVPRPSRAASDQKLEPGKAWERG